MSKRNVWGPPKGWTDIGSDVSWDEYGGRWAKRGAGRKFYVIDFTNMYDACGEDECKADGQAQYVCEVNLVDLDDLPVEQIQSALRSCGMHISSSHDSGHAIYSDMGDIIAFESDRDRFDLVLVEVCHGYGAKAPLDSLSSDTGPLRLRAQARRIAESYMRDERALVTRMSRPVNRIGSTAREYMRGDLNTALDRGPVTFEQYLMRKLHGMKPREGGAS